MYRRANRTIETIPSRFDCHDGYMISNDVMASTRCDGACDE